MKLRPKLRIFGPQQEEIPIDTRVKVAIGYPHGGTVRAEFLNSVVRLNIWEFGYIPLNDKYKIDSFSAAGSIYVAKNRNDIVKDFLKSDAEWLFQLDPDEEFKPDLLKRMMDVALSSPEHKIVSGLYISYRREHPEADLILVPVLYNDAEDGKFRNLVDVPKDSLIEVAMAGSGCLLVHREVYEKMLEAHKDDPWPWFSHEPSQDRTEMLGEDVVFCIRARKLGYKIWAKTDILLRHYKTIPLTIDDWWKEIPITPLPGQ